MSVRDYQSFRGNSYPPPHGSMLHRLVTCDVCGITIGLWLPDKLPAKYANWPIKCDYPTCKSQDMNTETPTTADDIDSLFSPTNEGQPSHNQGARYSIRKHGDGMPMLKIMPSDRVGFDWMLYQWAYVIGAKRKEYHGGSYHTESEMIDYINVLIERYGK